MIRYASRTGTRAKLQKLKAAGWRLMVSARGRLRSEGFAYALDNGAWTAFQEWLKGVRPTPVLDLAAFRRAVDLMGAGADFNIVPDVVANARLSWPMTRYWLRKLRRDHRLKGVRLMLAVQDGMEPELVSPYLSASVGIFVGGSTEWKEATAALWVRVAHERGALCHVGRVNTARRARLCDVAGVDSYDGSGPSIFDETLRVLNEAHRQPDLEGWLNREGFAG